MIEKQGENTSELVASIKKIEEGITHMSKNQVQQISKVVNSTVNHFDSSLKDSITSITQAYAKSAESVIASVNALDTVSEGLSTQMKDATAVVTNTLTAMQSSVSNFQSSIESSTSNLVDSISTLETHLTQKASTLGENVTTLSEKLTTVANRIEETSNKTAIAAEKFQTSISGSGDAFVAASSKAGETFTQIIDSSGTQFATHAAQAGEASGRSQPEPL